MSFLSNYLASDTDVLAAANIMGEYTYGDTVNDNDKEVQCDLITEDAGHHRDPTRLTYKERIRWHLKEFCYKTSSHGIPMLGQAQNTPYRLIWIVLLLSCGCMFIYQACDVVNKYRRMDKITDIQLKFDTAPFPAITLCNLNPYRDSLVRNVEAIKKIISVFNGVMQRAGDLNVDDRDKRKRAESAEKSESAEKPEIPKQGKTRKRRAANATNLFEPALSVCECESTDGKSDCVANVTAHSDEVHKHMRENAKMCKCAFDRDSGDAWPCYPEPMWSEDTCEFCDNHAVCQRTSKELKKQNVPCLCQSHDPFCVKYEAGAEILKLWEYYGHLIPDDPKMIEALGFQNMTDEVAIVTKAKENIIFAMSELTEDARRELSMQKHQMIQKCSFNGQACDIDKDFLIISDPTFGNCFTFNHDRNDSKISIRAGPMYGLRVLMFVNSSDYLPTTEAVGVRMTIHDKDEFPFPDTFGYSAPTGYVSSFGMRMQKMSRLPAPFGDCVPNGKTMNYIYSDYIYSTEGCYRTCFQNMVLRECGCGDPRFPVLGDAVHCKVFNPDERKCLDAQTKELGNVHSSFKCRCQQPCDQSVYTVSYSEAIWPSQSLNISLGQCNMTPEECNEQYQENGAMLEVFYEALNYEVFSEVEAYGIVKMLADFGGQLGLWSGVSFMTVCEFLCLGCEVAYMVFMHHYQKYKRRQWEKRQEAM